MSLNSTSNIQSAIRKGAFQPHQYLSNLCLANFQNGEGFVSGKLFPVVPVPLSTSHYYEFSKGDLARDNMAAKPIGGKVSPSVITHSEGLYKCEVHQVIMNIDQFSALDYSRNNTPNAIDPRKAKVRFISEQMKLHQDILWAESYFNMNSWNEVYMGVDSNPTSSEFFCFDNDNSDPVEFINKVSLRMELSGMRKPNKMCLGAKVYAALKTNPCILDRIKYQGSQANPANVTLNVLAQLFGLDEIVVSSAVVNTAERGQPDNMEYVCTPNDALLVYATNAPSVEEPSAGYSFAWDMLGNGAFTPVLVYEGEKGTHSEVAEGLIAMDQKVTCPDLGVYLSGAVSDDYTV